jgi:hypothetical protein
MKSFFVLLLASVVIPFTACSQKISSSKVPEAVKESFTRQFPGITPAWEKEKEKFEAGFKQSGHEMSAVFDTNGTMTESEMAIKITALPPTAIAYIKKTYTGAVIKEAAKITLQSGEINYEAEVRGTDLLFDVKGVFIKQVKE